MKHSLRSIAAIGLLSLPLASHAVHGGSTPDASEPHPSTVAADAVKWGPAPATFRPGAQAAVLLGHPAKEGPFVLRLKFPAGFVVAPHSHSKDELVTVISGRFAVSAGDRIDRASMKPLPAASFIHLPAGTPHYAWAESETVVQINGMGPFDVKYANPGDDPRNQ